MSSRRIGLVARTWFKWKALRLPWRKRFLVGLDLNGNTYWEFRLTTRGARKPDDEQDPSAERWRRIVEYPRSTYLSQVKVSPQWHQWLRYTRPDPPSLDEQHGDVARQVRMRQLAAEADARWEAKPRLTDGPPGTSTWQPTPALEPLKPGEAAPVNTKTNTQTKKREAPAEQVAEAPTPEGKPDPWAQARAHGPGEKWQPQSWSPTPAKKR